MPPRPPTSHLRGAKLLAERDPVMAGLYAEVGPPRLRQPAESHFAALVRSVLYQQLAGRAAAAIHARLIATLGGTATPEALLATPPEALRAAGLSANKSASLSDLAGKVAAGSVVLEDGALKKMSDEEVIAALCTVRGIGPWTAQMFLIFQLRRPDVWPAGDLGVRRGYGLAYGVPMPSERELQPLGERFAPYRSVAAWYFWRACEVVPFDPGPAGGGPRS